MTEPGPSVTAIGGSLPSLELRRDLLSALMVEYAQCGENIRWCANNIVVLFGGGIAGLGYLAEKLDDDPVTALAKATATPQDAALFLTLWATTGLAYLVIIAQAVRTNHYWRISFRRGKEIENMVKRLYPEAAGIVQLKEVDEPQGEPAGLLLRHAHAGWGIRHRLKHSELTPLSGARVAAEEAWGADGGGLVRSGMAATHHLAVRIKKSVAIWLVGGLFATVWLGVGAYAVGRTVSIAASSPTPVQEAGHQDPRHDRPTRHPPHRPGGPTPRRSR